MNSKLRGWEKQNYKHLMNKKAKETAKAGWYNTNLKIARQRDIVFIIMVLSLIGNILQVVL